MSTGYFSEAREDVRVIRLLKPPNDAARLEVQQGRVKHEVDVYADKSSVTVGCTRIDRDAWEFIKSQVKKSER